jgi:hypothetical protein
MDWMPLNLLTGKIKEGNPSQPNFIASAVEFQPMTNMKEKLHDRR